MQSAKQNTETAYESFEEIWAFSPDAELVVTRQNKIFLIMWLLAELQYDIPMNATPSTLYKDVSTDLKRMNSLQIRRTLTSLLWWNDVYLVVKHPRDEPVNHGAGQRKLEEPSFSKTYRAPALPTMGKRKREEPCHSETKGAATGDPATTATARGSTTKAAKPTLRKTTRAPAMDKPVLKTAKAVPEEDIPAAQTNETPHSTSENTVDADVADFIQNAARYALHEDNLDVLNAAIGKINNNLRMRAFTSLWSMTITDAARNRVASLLSGPGSTLEIRKCSIK